MNHVNDRYFLGVEDVPFVRFEDKRVLFTQPTSATEPSKVQHLVVIFLIGD